MEQRKRSERNQRCPECSSVSLVQDEETGDILCSSCGRVVAERVPVEYAERYPRKGGISPEGARPQLSLAKTGLAVGVPELGRGPRFLRTVGYYSKRERTLARALKLITNLADKLNLSQPITERAAYFYRIAVREGLLVGRPAKLLATAALYASCRESGVPRSINTVAKAASLGRTELAREYRTLADVLNLRAAVVGPERYVASIASLLSIDERKRREAYSILARAERNGLAAGKDPKSLAAAALYVVSRSLVERAKQVDFAEAAGVTTATLRKRLQQLEKYLRPASGQQNRNR